MCSLRYRAGVEAVADACVSGTDQDMYHQGIQESARDAL